VRASPIRKALGIAPIMQIAGELRRTAPKVGRNDPCPYDSGKKHKRRCGRGDGGLSPVALQGARRPALLAARPWGR